MKKGMSLIWPTNAGALSLVAERHTFAMDSMGSMPHPPAHSPSNRAVLRPFLNCQKLPPSLDDPLLALERVVSVDYDFRVVPEEL